MKEGRKEGRWKVKEGTVPLTGENKDERKEERNEDRNNKK
jgi:hypothetical protein